MENLHEQWLSDLKHNGIDLTQEQLEQFEIYYELLVDWNQRVNLTAITDREQVFYKHFFDSLSLSFCVSLENEVKLADIGSGAGFPGVPLAIAFPNIKVTIVDSLQKRITFLEHLIERLNLKHVQCIHGRAEEIGRNENYREQFNLVTARAVARLQVLNEYCLPFVKVGGLFAAMKAVDVKKEIVEASRSLQLLGGKMERTYQFQLPFEQARREIVVVKKIKPTPKKYPRKPGMPAKQPL